MSDFSLNVNGETLEFFAPEDAFIPTGTSKIMIDSVKKRINKPVKLLDLGCGIGVVGIALNHIGLVKGPLHVSDLGESAIEAAKLNCKHNNCEAVVKCGSLYQPWDDMKFDCIVNDISGVAEEVAKISPWFNGVSCKAGDDGSLLVNKVIEQSNDHLSNGGQLFFPVISLSKTDKIVDHAKNYFRSVELIMKKHWPLPDSMLQHKELLFDLNEKGIISIEEKFGLIQWYTEIYVANNY